MAEDLLDTIGQLFGAIRGGVAYAVVFVGALLAATTGVVAASVLAMGLISLPVMMRYGYSNRLSTGVIAASGTLAQIIPPSLVLIVLADQMGASVGDFYEGALIPGLALAVRLRGVGGHRVDREARSRAGAARPRRARSTAARWSLQGVHLDDPAAGADLPRAGHDLPRRRDAHRGRRDGRERRDHHGARQAQARACRCSSRRWSRPRR